MAEFQFSIEQDLELEEATEAMFELLDFFEENDNFDEIEWDEEEEVAFLANDDLEVEIALSEGYIDVSVNILAPDLTRKMIRRNLVEDINKHFGLGRSVRRHQSRSRGRDWREEHSFERATQRRERFEEEERSSRSKRKKPGRFGRPRPLDVVEEKREKRTRSRGGAKRLRGDRLEGKSGKKRSAPTVLPFSKKEKETAPKPAVETKETAPNPAVETKDTASKPAVETKDTASKPAVETKETAPKPAVETKETAPKPAVEVKAEEIIEEEVVEIAVKEEKAKEEAAEAKEEVVEAKEEAAEAKEEAISVSESDDLEEVESKGKEESKAVTKAESQTVASEEEESGGGWFLFFLLLLAGGFVLFYMSPLWPGK